MKRLLLSLLTFLVFANVAMADAEYDARIVHALRLPTFSKEEEKQTLFSASFPEGYSPGTIAYAFYNPSRDKSIMGIVINISKKDVSTGQEQSVDLFIDVDCGPLQCLSNQETFTVLANLVKSTPAVTLKEVHYSKLTEAETSAAADATPSATKQNTEVIVRLFANGTTGLNGSAITTDELPTKFKELAGLPEKTEIIINADKDVPYAQVVKVLDLCREAGLSHVSFSTTSPVKSGK